MADEQKPEGPPAPPPAGGEAKPAPPTPAAGGHAAPPKPPATMAATPWDSDLARSIKERFGEQVTEASTYLGQNFVVCKPEAAIPLVEFLKLEADFDGPRWMFRLQAKPDSPSLRPGRPASSGQTLCRRNA